MNDAGPGAAIGAGFGAASGIMTGIGLDVAEGTQLQQQREIDELGNRIYANKQGIVALQNRMDRNSAPLTTTGGTLSVYFDSDRASLKIGAVAQLQRFAAAVRGDSSLERVEVHGYSDDTGSPVLNQRLSEARARSVQNILAQNGVPLDRVHVMHHGAESPIASNQTAEGKQLNRRVEVLVRR